MRVINNIELIAENNDEKLILDLLVEKQILDNKDSENVYTISDKLMNNLKFDCLNDAEYIMGLYNSKRIKRNAVCSCTVEGEYDIGDNRIDNIRNVEAVTACFNEAVSPKAGNAYFICNMNPRAKKGVFKYHAAAVIINYGMYFYTLETWSEINEDNEEKHCGGFFIYNTSRNGNFHYVKKDEFGGDSVKTVEIKLKN